MKIPKLSISLGGGFRRTFFTITVSLGEDGAVLDLETKGLSLSSSLFPHEPWRHLQERRMSMAREKRSDEQKVIELQFT